MPPCKSNTTLAFWLRSCVPTFSQVCHLDCWEASDINDMQRRWLHPPYDVSNSLSRLPLGFKVRWCPGVGLIDSG